MTHIGLEYTYMQDDDIELLCTIPLRLLFKRTIPVRILQSCNVSSKSDISVIICIQIRYDKRKYISRVLLQIEVTS